MNYFQLFNLAQAFEIDISDLKQRYQTLQKLTHPDRFASSSDQEKRIYMQKNAQVNDGYHVLQSPILRGEHLLQIRGFELADEQATMGDTAFLMEQMELREALADASSAADCKALIENVASLQNEMIQTIASQLHANTDDANAQAALSLTKLKFLSKLADEADTKQSSFDD